MIKRWKEKKKKRRRRSSFPLSSPRSIQSNQSMSESSPPIPTTPSAIEAAAKREARKQKILSKGSDRLAKITKAGRGQDSLYSTEIPTSSSSSSTTTKQQQPSSASSTYEDPDEVDISVTDLGSKRDPDYEKMMKMLHSRMGGGFGNTDITSQQAFEQGSNNPTENNPLAAMMAALSGGGSGSGQGTGEPGAPNLLFDPALLMGAFSGQGGQGGDPSAFGGLNFNGQAVERTTRNTSDRIFDALHSLLMIALGGFVAFSALSRGTSSSISLGDATTLKDNLLSPISAGLGLHSWQRWASLGYLKPAEWEAASYAPQSLGLPVNLEGVVSVSAMS